MPSSVAGSFMFSILPPGLWQGLLGVFLICTVILRRALPHPEFPVVAFLPLGMTLGLLSAIFGSVGPLMAPWFLDHGLVK
eukprot:gene3759-4163_t